MKKVVTTNKNIHTLVDGHSIESKLSGTTGDDKTFIAKYQADDIIYYFTKG